MEPTEPRQQKLNDCTRSEFSVGDFAFRPLEARDIPALAEIERLSFTTPWSEDAFHYELEQNQFAQYTVATCGDCVVGHCGMWVIIDEAHITNIAIHPAFRGQKLGEKLMCYVMVLAKAKGADKMTLEVRPSNTVALKLYQKLGFQHEGTRPNYYADDREDAWIMWVTLDDKHFGD